MSFIENAWYMAAWSADVTDAIFPRRLLDQPVVLFRQQDGAIAALADRCAHRFAPLRFGSRVDGTVQCAYHGLRYDGQGQCVENPMGDGRIPTRAVIRAYPVIERHQMIWIWMGDPARADPADIPDYSMISETPQKVHNLGSYLMVKANYLLEIDNLMDLSHVNFLHDGTLGNETMRCYQVRVSQEGAAIRADLVMENSIAPGFSPMAGQRCDQWNNIIWRAPTSMLLEFGAVAPGAERVQDVANLAIHIVTPETERTTHYFFGTCGVFEDSEGPLAAMIREAQTRAFVTEDSPMIEAIDAEMDGADLWSLQPALLSTDTAAVRVRRQIEKLVREDQASRLAPSASTREENVPAE